MAMEAHLTYKLLESPVQMLVASKGSLFLWVHNLRQLSIVMVPSWFTVCFVACGQGGDTSPQPSSTAYQAGLRVQVQQLMDLTPQQKLYLRQQAERSVPHHHSSRRCNAVARHLDLPL
jgi:hypothetical protein